MNDEQKVRSLLAVAAEPPDQVQPPVAQLVERARRARMILVACSVLGIGRDHGCGVHAAVSGLRVAPQPDHFHCRQN